MTKNEIRIILERISEEYEFDLKEVTRKFLDFKTYSIIDDENALKCLELYCDLRIPFLNMIENGEEVDMQDYANTEECSFNYALYNIIGDEIVPYLSPKYLEMNKNIIHGNEFGININ